MTDSEEAAVKWLEDRFPKEERWRRDLNQYEFMRLKPDHPGACPCLRVDQEGDWLALFADAMHVCYGPYKPVRGLDMWFTCPHGRLVHRVAVEEVEKG